jgi:hypothetical protein
MANLVVLVTGSRTWTDRGFVHATLTDVFDARGSFTLRQGEASRGPDVMADDWARDHPHLGIVPDGMPVTSRDWTRMGPSAGLLRNERMVATTLEAVADGWDALCLAFLMPCRKPGCRRPQPHFTHGGEHCAKLAEALGIPTDIYTEDDAR